MEKGGRKEVEYSERGRKKMTGERGAEKVKRCKERRKNSAGKHEEIDIQKEIRRAKIINHF